MSSRTCVTWLMKSKMLLLLLAVFLLWVTPQVHAVPLILSDLLSDYSSNGAGAPDVNEMDATLNFDVVGNTLTLGVTNDTPDPTIPGAFSLNINEIYFNTSENITGLSLTAIDGAPLSKWTLTYNVNNIQVNDFGLYDVSLIDGVDNQPHVIHSQGKR